jgi:hypothetical protein
MPAARTGTNTDQSPGPAGLLEQDSEKRPGKVKVLAAASTLRGDQRCTMAASAPSGKPGDVQPIRIRIFSQSEAGISRAEGAELLPWQRGCPQPRGSGSKIARCYLGLGRDPRRFRHGRSRGGRRQEGNLVTPVSALEESKVLGSLACLFKTCQTVVRCYEPDLRRS